MSSNLTAEYKGKRYKIVWNGPTKYGRRAKLAFFDGSREFWVDETALSSVTHASHGPRRSGGCRECGGPIRDASHHRAMGGLCGSCAFDEYDC